MICSLTGDEINKKKKKKKKKTLDTSASAQYIRTLFARLLSVIGVKNENQEIKASN